ncbi:MAG: hypothetical protein IFNCLDLE_02612 [Ignavibacteriaceae bacterium]|nr:hypothetical protein [Ignavibacteriaceae bacterium]
MSPMWTKKPRRRNPPIRRSGSKGFPEGLNTIAHGSTLKDSELSELINGIYSQYGTISKRQGTQITGQAASGATKITQLKATYKVGGVDRFIRISNSGKPEVYNFNTSTWDLLTGTAPDGYSGDNPTFTDGTPTFDTTVITWIVQIQTRIYFGNSVNELIYFDEDGTWHIYNTLANPSTKPTVAKTGSATGYTTYFYRYVWYNEVGGTLASPIVDTGVDANGTGYYNSMPATLDTSTFLTVTLPSAPTGCTKVGIFRGVKVGEETYMTDVAPATTTFVDKGEIVPSEVFGVPDDNTTKGYHFSLLDTYRGSLVGVSTELGLDTLVWSGYLEKYGSFGVPDGAGYLPYRKGEGSTINAIIPFVASNEDALFIFKDNVFGKFQFVDLNRAESAGTIKDVNISVGSLSPFSPHVAGNNLRFWSQDGPATVGNEANYGTILRYSVLGLRADRYVKQVTAANLPEVCGVFHNHLSIFGISTDVAGTSNNSALVYDERYNAWALWTGVYPKLFAKCIGPDKIERLYYGSSKDANVLEMFSGRTDYRTSSGTGNKIVLSLTTKQYDLGLPDQFKKYDKATLVFGSLTGNNTTIGVIRSSAKGVNNDPRLRITSSATLSGFGGDEWGNQEFGMMTEETSGSPVNVQYINLKQQDLFWVKFNIQNDGIEDEIDVIGVYIYYSTSNKPLPFTTKVKTLA